MANAWISGSPTLRVMRLQNNNLNASQTKTVLDSVLLSPNLLNFVTIYLIWADFTTSYEQLASVLDH